MTKYNIYAGENGKSRYLYTTLCDNILEAIEIAHQEMIFEYELSNTKTLKQIEKFWKKCGCKVNKNFVLQTYDFIRDSWGEYNAIPTEDDTILFDNLIFDYVDVYN